MRTTRRFDRRDDRILLAVNRLTRERIYVSLKTLQTHLLVLGCTGQGKTMLLYRLYQALARRRRATVVLIDPKGDLFDLCLRYTLRSTEVKRLIPFDLNETERPLGYNPLRANALPIATQVTAVSEAILSAFLGQDSVSTPQLRRFLPTVLTISREQHLTLVDALSLLRPGHPLREQVLPRIEDPYAREEFEHLLAQRPEREDTLTASTQARLAAFAAHPHIRSLVADPGPGLDLHDVIEGHRILLVSLKPGLVRREDCRLLGRLLLNDLLAHLFDPRRTSTDPIYCLIDEAANFATRDLATALDEGRSRGLNLILAAQHLAQFRDEDQSGYLYHSVMNDARLKIIFGGSSIEDLETLAPEFFLDEYDSYRVKDEITSLECEPIEETRTTVTRTRSGGESRGLSLPESVTEEESETDGTSETHAESEGEDWTENTSHAQTKGNARADGVSLEKSTQEGTSDGTSEGETKTKGRGRADVTGRSAGSGTMTGGGSGVTVLPDGQVITSAHETGGTSNFTGASEAHVESENESSAKNSGRSHGKNRSTGASEGASLTTTTNTAETDGEGSGYAEHASTTETSGTNHAKTRGTSRTHGRVPSVSEQTGWSESQATAPFHAYRKRRVTSSRTFQSEREFIIEGIQKLRLLPKQHIAVKSAGKPAAFGRVPFFPEPTLSPSRRACLLGPVLDQAGCRERKALPAPDAPPSPALLLAPPKTPPFRPTGGRA